jgi:hypothetical protein
MKTLIRFFLTLVLTGMIKITSSAEDPALICFSFKDINSIKEEIKSGKDDLKPAFNKLIHEADLILKVTPATVIDGDNPPSGNKHDFFAIGKLAFPNPNTPDGLPYIRRDGVLNPEADGDKYDLKRYNTTVSSVKTLTLAWYYSGNRKYADKAAELLRVWFINSETRMNPHFDYASALPGVYNGMPIGIIFGVTLIEMVDYVKLLTLSDSWTNADNEALKKWFSDLTTWLLESKFGKEEGLAKNNHGSWYASQVAAYSIYTGNIETARSMVNLGRKQIDEQIARDGSLPKELVRQRSYHYSIYGMQAFTTLALCAQNIREDLWHYKTSDGRGLELAFGFLIPYFLDEKPWAWTNIENDSPVNINALSIIRWASRTYQSSDISKAAKYLNSRSPADSREAYLTGK